MILSILQEEIAKVANEKSEIRDLLRIIMESWEDDLADHVDSGFIKPFPVPLVVIGGKYDVFQVIQGRHN